MGRIRDESKANPRGKMEERGRRAKPFLMTRAAKGGLHFHPWGVVVVVVVVIFIFST